MTVVCLDLEGVLVPEIWQRVAKSTKIDALNLTTRDIPNYDTLMRHRLNVLAEHNIGMDTITECIEKMRPLPGARDFLDTLRTRYQVLILSDTFVEFASPLMAQLRRPTLLCNSLTIQDNRITGYTLRQRNGKRKAVKAFQRLGYKVIAAGDSYNDLTMIKKADTGMLFRAPDSICKKCGNIPQYSEYGELLAAIDAAATAARPPR